MKPLNLSSYKLAKELHLTVPRVNDIVRETRAVTADTAVRLSRYFGMPAEFCRLKKINIKPYPRSVAA